ncbi:hypothetical protein [Streptomyces sp. LS1784]|uniref:hypothetical protein n=1 Tax=Streptomyces sp. LS1784 TaxID=2851533 RepID=UPI001CCF0D9E|nr:hypothetical protein [Streptomyces sp. LS1784]
MLGTLIALSIGAFALLLWLDWRSRHRVRPVRAAEVTPEQIRHVASRQPQDGDQ